MLADGIRIAVSDSDKKADDLKKAAKVNGFAVAGQIIGAAIGSFCPGAGTAIGGLIGGIFGSFLGSFF